jgi:hypothetical protein
MTPIFDQPIAIARSIRCQWLLAMAIAAVHFAGCGPSDGLTRVVVNGEVRLNGSPIERGQIRFIPNVDTAGPVTIEDIHNGEYSCQRSGGVPIGQHRVEILGCDPKVPFPTGPGGLTPKQLVPKKYNVDSELTVTLDDESDPVVKDFEL